METMEFINYVREMMRQGLSYEQIAKKLGMDILEFQQKCQAAYDKVEGVVKNVVKPAMEKKPIEKPVSGAAEPKRERKAKVEGIYYVPQNEDKFMDEPMIGKTIDTQETQPV